MIQNNIDATVVIANPTKALIETFSKAKCGLRCIQSKEENK